MTIAIDICCNDADNGLFTGRADAIQIGSLEFEALRDPAPRLVELADGGLRLSGKVWPVAWSKEYYGNWCWNRYVLAHKTKTSAHTVVDFLIWLQSRKLYSCECAPADLHDWWRDPAKHPMSPRDLHTVLLNDRT